MKSRIAVCCLLLSLGLASVAFAAAKPTVASVLDGQLTGAEHELVPAAEAMPADKFAFAPTQGEFKGVRNFGSQIKHIASVNYLIGAAILGTKPPVELGDGEDGPANIKSKDEIVKYLKESFTYLHQAINSITEANMLEPIKAPWGKDPTTRLAMGVIANSHPFDHYGQVVEYLRANGIIPPASRG
ncbi:MAG TPA: DinB family protein [Candidatus Angelobacter sp.]|nr:DinB family protein [Candidatus Angelobacter sp.]